MVESPPTPELVELIKKLCYEHTPGEFERRGFRWLNSLQISSEGLFLWLKKFHLEDRLTEFAQQGIESLHALMEVIDGDIDFTQKFTQNSSLKWYAAHELTLQNGLKHLKDEWKRWNKLNVPNNPASEEKNQGDKTATQVDTRDRRPTQWEYEPPELGCVYVPVQELRKVVSLNEHARKLVQIEAYVPLRRAVPNQIKAKLTQGYEYRVDPGM